MLIGSKRFVPTMRQGWREQSTSDKRIQEYRRWVIILAIALGIAVTFVFFLLVLDLFNPHIGWVQGLAG